SITTSLRVGFAALGPGFDGESGVVFYAATPGAFVDLAADFGYALDTPITTASSTASSADSTDGDGQDGRDHTDVDRQQGDHHDGDGQHGPSRSDRNRLIVLDADLPPTATRSGLVGLDERSMIDRAIGVMLDQGHHPDGAHATLRQHAAAAGVEPHTYAARLLRD
ncbi:MAG TPA: ANTAR domain-containing protein, partial [Propionibacteriaceae bacterium]|nr:ANTAR domain-containing protein [Propionibacteriaceae bacterium]